MSILIKSMAMPDNCMDCPMNYDSIDCVLRNDISLRNKTLEFMYESNRHPNCPLIELSQHGRLIDADALYKAIRTDIMGGLNYEHFIKTAPTVIESEEEE